MPWMITRFSFSQTSWYNWKVDFIMENISSWKWSLILRLFEPCRLKSKIWTTKQACMSTTCNFSGQNANKKANWFQEFRVQTVSANQRRRKKKSNIVEFQLSTRIKEAHTWRNQTKKTGNRRLQHISNTR